MGWTQHAVTLDLSQQWAMSRKRIWILLQPADWKSGPLPAWPTCHPQMTIGDLLPTWRSWPDHEEQQLALSPREIQMYTNTKYGHDRRILAPHDVAPTTLHSYSVALQACPCGCRDTAFATDSLESRGLRGYFVPSQVTGQPRFLHPKELSVLLTIPADMSHGEHLRSSNCLLGLIAAPLQSLWIYAHLVKSASQHFRNLAYIEPTVCLRTFKQLLRQQAGTMCLDESPQLTHLTIQVQDEPPIHIVAPTSATVGHFLAAETITLDWGHSQHLSVGANSLAPSQALKHLTGTVCLFRPSKRQRTSPPLGHLVIGIVHQDQCLVEILTAGSFLFDALASANLPQVKWVLTEDGKCYGADYRVWHSQRFHTLAEDTFPAKPPGGHPAGSADSSTAGLSASTLHQVLQSLLANIPDQVSPPWLLPPLALAQADMTALLQDIERQQAASWHDSAGHLFMPLEWDGHWTLLEGDLQPSGIQWRHFDGLRAAPPPKLHQFLIVLSQALGEPFQSLRHQVVIRQPSPDSCGTVVVAHFCHQIGLCGQFGPQQIQQLHHALQRHDNAHGPRACGNNDQLSQLAALLASKGGPSPSSHTTGTRGTTCPRHHQHSAGTTKQEPLAGPEGRDNTSWEGSPAAHTC